MRYKKVTFLQHIIETLQLKDVIAVHGRAEELAHKPEYRAKADIVVNLPGLNDGRHLLVWEQQKSCPAQFPRGGSQIAKKPLGETANNR